MACVGAYTCSSTNVETLVRESSWFVGYKQGTQALVLRLDHPALFIPKASACFIAGKNARKRNCHEFDLYASMSK